MNLTEATKAERFAFAKTIAMTEVNRTVKFEFRNRFYKGTVENYDPETGLYEVRHTGKLGNIHCHIRRNALR